MPKQQEHANRTAEEDAGGLVRNWIIVTALNWRLENSL
jgi:hypothetical protein